jgi:hypothetical protein
LSFVVRLARVAVEILAPLLAQYACLLGPGLCRRTSALNTFAPERAFWPAAFS